MLLKYFSLQGYYSKTEVKMNTIKKINLLRDKIKRFLK